MTDPRYPRRGEHETFDELAVGWALHALEPEDEELFAAHLPTCPRCRQTVTETTDVMGALVDDLPPVDPPERLRDRLRTAVEETEQLPRPAREDERAPLVPPTTADGPVPVYRFEISAAGAHRAAVPAGVADPRSPWRRVLPNALVAAAVAAILALGTWIVVLDSAREEAQAAAAEQAEVLESVLQPGRATIAPVYRDGDGEQVATVVAREAQLEVVTRGLRVNDDSDSVYVVWGMVDDSPVALGTFDVVSPQTDLRTVGSASTGLDGYVGYAISIEPGRQMPSEPTDVVASGQVTS